MCSSPAVALDLTERWRPSPDTVFFANGRLFVVVQWHSADRKLLKEFLAGLEQRLADANGGPK